MKNEFTGTLQSESSNKAIASGKKSLMKKKLMGIPVFLLMIFGVFAIGGTGVLYSTLTVVATVDEALSTTTFVLPLPESIYMGTFSSEIVIQNSADIDLNTEILWIESLNDNGVIYTTDMPKVVTLTPGENIISVEFTISNDSPVGDFQGNIMLERVA